MDGPEAVSASEMNKFTVTRVPFLAAWHGQLSGDAKTVCPGRFSFYGNFSE